jgi:ABC-2 type transport system ATP-binding protein
VDAPLLELRAVTKQFGGQDALAGVSARFAPGTLGLVGPNGAGKTTLLRLLLGLIPPTSGDLRVFGADPAVEPLRVRERVGYMPEHDCLIPSMSGVGFVAYMARVSGLPKEVAMGRAHDVLQFVGLHEERYRKIAEYSVGMRQRVKLAQAIVHDPPLCFLDEPTAGLDPTGRAEMLHLLGTLSRMPGHNLVLSTHLLPDVEGLCDQILLLNAGRSLAAGPLGPLLRSRPGEVVVRFKGEATGFVARLASSGLSPERSGNEVRLALPDGGERLVFQAALDSGVQVRYLGSSVASVEELFLSLVNASGPEAVR